MSIKYSEPPYDLSYFQSLHYQLFSKLYNWAGKLRDVNIYKNDTPFCYYQYIENESNRLFTQLKKEKWLKNLEKDIFCEKLAEYYCEFNMIHLNFRIK